MIEVEKARELEAYVGKTIGTSDWLLIDQALIDQFAAVTGDRQWIHVDTERAKRELPDGRTIAHGYLLLSLLPSFTPSLLLIRNRKSALNYGLNRVRFTATVPAGSRVRLAQGVKSVSTEGSRTQIVFESTMEVEGSPKPAMIAETITVVFD